MRMEMRFRERKYSRRSREIGEFYDPGAALYIIIRNIHFQGLILDSDTAYCCPLFIELGIQLLS
jgi:hypothetical protein